MVTDDENTGRAVFLKRQLASVADVPLHERSSDPKWRSAATRRLEELGVHQYELAEHVGASKALMSYLLTGRKAQPKGRRAPAVPRRRRVSEVTGEQEIVRSAFVERVSVALGIDLPLTAEFEQLALDAMRSNDSPGLEWMRATIRLRKVPDKP